MWAGMMLMSVSVLADGPQAMFGVTYTWGGEVGSGDVGISIKVVSSREKHQLIGAAGVTYYPWAPLDKFGADLSAGYLFERFALTGGWDFIRRDWIVSAGYVNTIEKSDGDPTSEQDPPADGNAGTSDENPTDTPPSGEGAT